MANIVEDITTQEYKYGFTTNVDTDILAHGLNEDVIRTISAKKNEPQWLLDFRLKAYRKWLTMPVPTWAHLNIPDIDFQAISYYAAPKKQTENTGEIDPEIQKTFDKLGIPRENIVDITMPGFGTTGRTYNNSINMMKSLGVTIKEVDIKPACLQHLKDIDHDLSILDVSYENTQARERTQILMDYSNKIGGLVIGTGDLSELVLGWPLTTATT